MALGTLESKAFFETEFAAVDGNGNQLALVYGLGHDDSLVSIAVAPGRHRSGIAGGCSRTFGYIDDRAAFYTIDFYRDSGRCDGLLGKAVAGFEFNNYAAQGVACGYYSSDCRGRDISCLSYHEVGSLVGSLGRLVLVDCKIIRTHRIYICIRII